MKIITVLGAKPQFIKAGSVSREIERQKSLGADIQEIIIHTGQHYDANMSDVFFEEMQIPKPDYFLGIGGNTHGAMTGQMLEKIEAILLQEKPDWLMIYGDTNSTLAGALAAAKLHIKIAHVEAGLRSFNTKMPEEINRILADRISTLLFCPTPVALANLAAEGVQHWGAKVVLSGDVMQDGALFYHDLAQKPDPLTQLTDFVLCTLHRAENTDDIKRLSGIVAALNQIAEMRQIILPLHPRTRQKLAEMENIKISSKIILLNPLGYLNMVYLLKHCALVMTDSGGLQKEAFFFHKPCITLRDETEWVELVEHGYNVLVDADKEIILNAYHSAKFTEDFNVNLYGEGKASARIVSELVNF
ncbi:non-hydrolyzing UDP-N-acetylglucosamine 2-epimerase [Crenothrix polyspora]|uniref:UDP-2,3-diacetamido-2,3-dideoxy-D-glucuronate 2-epimerase n=1 Tax=Crenothrix polyspora TaxID=360316 RepID=A0A1R4HB47_9GAMM|nr:UDP-N-acetylglucosamine 2-epimerase (non-hydrolyzing) [Crenothrix polyspora]SJM93465.1 UDP-2,3-diacetamido-2,3-dideoxy-D-glucuronate 2-epimerase [Crenothrix polyspora]